MRRFGLRLVTAAAGVLIAGAASADTYPISGKWTYDNPGADGPAKNCGARYMSFEGNQRRDTGGSVPAFRNFKIEQTGNAQYRVTDQFDNAMINARQVYTLHILDNDHIKLDMVTGPTIALRRCNG